MTENTDQKIRAEYTRPPHGAWAVMSHDIDDAGEAVWDGGVPKTWAARRDDAVMLAWGLGAHFIAEIEHADGGWSTGAIHEVPAPDAVPLGEANLDAAERVHAAALKREGAAP